MQFNVGFTPVSITLSSQAEVDFFYTLLANAPDTLVGDFGLAEDVDELTTMLEMEASDLCFPEEYMGVEDFYPALDGPCECGLACASCNTGIPNESYQHKPESLGELMQREHSCKGGCEACTGCNAADSNYEAEETTFQPFSITVPDQPTADYLAALVGSTTSDIDKAFGVGESIWELHDQLQAHSNINYTYDKLNVTLNQNN